MNSLLVKNTWLADGTGAPLRRADVLVEAGRIRAVETEIAGSAVADQIIDIRRRILAPGFIDAHGHSDLSLLARPEGFGKASQGATTEIAGNCGLSAFPLTEHNRAHLEELYRQYGISLEWSDYAGWRKALAERGARLRLHALTGHNTLRAAVAGYEQEELSGRDIDEMRRLLDHSLAAGSPGLSVGLLYVPGKFADRGELVSLLQVVAKHGKLCAVHLRSEGNALLESLEEMIDACRSAGLERLHISHFKTAGKGNWHKLDAALDLLEHSGLTISADRYPYTESMTQLSVILPGAWSDWSDEKIQRELAQPAQQQVLARELAEARPVEYWQTVRLTGTGAPGLAGYAGKTLDRIAPLLHLTPPELTVKLLAADAAGTTAGFQGMSPDNLRRILALPYTVCGSDESARPLDYSIGRSHPRGFGSLPRFLKMRLEAGASPEAAVRQVTGLPAEIFGLKDAGVIRPGLPADLTAFNPEELSGIDDFAHPHTPASGLLFTLLSGTLTVRV